ncbi:hypothetical protein DSO57_1034536 [Entomophthora muscae]|uniref:Uncharacterized protein n=1 Tax=Entomophthora muscae TaxID=34485 RepID=A0ACC2SD60_9FUNG|nr:hypothetical protein DSO57_1034536 [Entomophthora muscae]
MLDRALMYILSDESSKVSAAQFLTGCWERAMVIRSNLATRGAATLSPDVLNARIEILRCSSQAFYFVYRVVNYLS